jgi:PAS domain S-box-containing protein
MFPRKTSIATITVLSFVAVATVLMGALGTINYSLSEKRQLRQLQGELDVAADQVAAGLASPVWNFDRQQVERVVESVMRNRVVLAVRVDANGERTAWGRDARWSPFPLRAENEPEGTSFRDREIRFAGKPIGSVRLWVTSAFLEDELRIIRRDIVSLVVLADLILVLGSYLILRRYVINPIRELERYAQAVSTGGSGSPPSGEAGFQGEIESLRVSIERMVGLLEQRYAALEASQLKIRGIFDLSFGLVGLLSPEGNLLEANRTALDFAGVKWEDVAGAPFWETPWWSHSAEAQGRIRDAVERARRGELVLLETTVRSGDGSVRALDFSLKPVKDGEGRVKMLIPEGRDVTARKSAEEERDRMREQLLHSQKMEGMGVLAGGVAHDFNNLLTVILGHSVRLLNRSAPDSNERAVLQQVVEAGGRAADLTKSLLAFSRKQVMDQKVADLNAIVGNLEKLLARLVGEDVSLHFSPYPGELPVHVDSGQIDQVLVNLAANARDAMPGGGTLNVSTEAVLMDAAFVGSHGFGAPGKYALLSVSDSGTGMDEETRQRAFEPFFTTKEQGRGTGLGLSIVYGIVKQHAGYLDIRSAPGNGTSMDVYLPLTGLRSEPSAPADERPVPGGAETVLVAEDDPGVRMFVTEVLRDFGYDVLPAADGLEAVETFRSRPGGIDLVVMDLIMPRLNGRAACAEIRASAPDARVLFTTGYAAEIIRSRGELEEGMELLMKPIAATDLLRKVREMLDRKKPA